MKMKHLKLFEHYANDRMKRRRYDEWSKLSDAQKRKKYDAEVQFKKITKKWDVGKSWYHNKPYWTIEDYFGGYAKSVFLSRDSELLNEWQRSEHSGYDDGVKKDFAKWLKKNKYSWTWDSLDTNSLEWDGIHIIPDFEGLYWYYEELAGVKPKLNKERKVRPEQNDKDIKEIIRLYAENGIDASDPPDSTYNDNDNRDRYEVIYEYGGMTIKPYIMKSNNLAQNVKNNIENSKDHFSRYSSDIKYVYDYCKTIAVGDLWTMPGGGGQLQQFYGDDDGYICVLYMGMRDDLMDDRVCSVQPEKNKKKWENFDKTPLKEFAELRNVANKYNL